MKINMLNRSKPVPRTGFSWAGNEILSASLIFSPSLSLSPPSLIPSFCFSFLFLVLFRPSRCNSVFANEPAGNPSLEIHPIRTRSSNHQSEIARNNRQSIISRGWNDFAIRCLPIPPTSSVPASLLLLLLLLLLLSSSPHLYPSIQSIAPPGGDSTVMLGLIQTTIQQKQKQTNKQTDKQASLQAKIERRESCVLSRSFCSWWQREGAWDWRNGVTILCSGSTSLPPPPVPPSLLPLKSKNSAVIHTTISSLFRPVFVVFISFCSYFLFGFSSSSYSSSSSSSSSFSSSLSFCFDFRLLGSFKLFFPLSLSLSLSFQTPLCQFDDEKGHRSQSIIIAINIFNPKQTTTPPPKKW